MTIMDDNDDDDDGEEENDDKDFLADMSNWIRAGRMGRRQEDFDSSSSDSVRSSTSAYIRLSSIAWKGSQFQDISP